MKRRLNAKNQRSLSSLVSEIQGFEVALKTEKCKVVKLQLKKVVCLFICSFSIISYYFLCILYPTKLAVCLEGTKREGGISFKEF